MNAKKFMAEEAKEKAHKIVKGSTAKKAKGKGKIEKVMREFKEKKLHSGSKKGPRVKKKAQAIAIAMNESRKAGSLIPKKKK